MKIRAILFLLLLSPVPLVAQEPQWSPIGTWHFNDTAVQWLHTDIPSGYSPTVLSAHLYDLNGTQPAFRIRSIVFEDTEVATVYFENLTMRAFYSISADLLRSPLADIILTFREPVLGTRGQRLSISLRRVDKTTFQYSYVFSVVHIPTDAEKNAFGAVDRVLLFPIVNFVGQMAIAQ